MKLTILLLPPLSLWHFEGSDFCNNGKFQFSHFSLSDLLVTLIQVHFQLSWLNLNVWSNYPFDFSKVLSALGVTGPSFIFNTDESFVILSGNEIIQYWEFWALVEGIRIKIYLISTGWCHLPHCYPNDWIGTSMMLSFHEMSPYTGLLVRAIYNLPIAVVSSLEQNLMTQQFFVFLISWLVDDTIDITFVLVISFH